MTPKPYADRLMEAASDALAWKPVEPTLNGRAIFSGIARCPVCLEFCDIEFPCCNEPAMEDGE